MAARSKKNRQPVYMIWRKLFDAEGRPIMALCASHYVDRNICIERGYGEGVEVRAEITNVRNSGFHRKIHALGQLVIKNIEEFSSMKDAHAVIKILQSRANVCCAEVVYDIPEVGMKLTRREPESIAYDRMTAERFEELWAGICAYISATWWPQVSGDRVSELAEIMLNEWG